jgi:DNA replication protein DnaD
MSTVVLTKVSSAELKLRQKLSEQREKEESKAKESRAKEAQKVITKISGTRMGLEALVNKTDFGTLPEMVRNQLQQLFIKLGGIHDSCTNIVESAGNYEGAMMTMLDTIHT